ncbi:MAG: aminotransferase DegT [Deltaproteobacteria bacterium RIFOXYD12_FULL_50_9]|nr:MAG: aminotransferase DegT [Deltaproteobacteria bacterium RIFOXYD12_FULL_50_9]
MTIQFIDLKTQYQRIAPAVKHCIEAVLEHGRFIMGPEISELEERLAAYVGSKYCVSCSSGTDALLMPLMALGIGPGDAVFTTPFTFMATAEVISLCGATPIFVDVDPVTFNIDPVKLALAVTAVECNDPSIYPLPKATGPLRPRAIIPVDLFGLPADYQQINALAASKGLAVIQDAAQSFGGVYAGKRTCSHGLCGATSFFPAKPLGCYGDGGAVFTDDAELKARFVSIRVHGQGTDKYENIRIGLNARMDTIQAAILLLKLDIFDEELAARQIVAASYRQRLSQIATLTLPPIVPLGSVSAWAQFSVLAKDCLVRDSIRARLDAVGIPTMIYYPKPLHLQNAYAGLGYSQGNLPVCEDLAGRIFSLPMHPYLEETVLQQICSEVENAVS